jgi:hypothetical protein
MANVDSPQEELLKEARRTTHAVRAIARFVLLLVSYQVFAALVLFVGSLMSASEEFLVPGLFFVVLGAVVAIVGLVHSLAEGNSELSLSDRFDTGDVESPASTAPEETELPRDENWLLEGTCSCTKWERAGATDVKNGVKYCTRCERVIPV